MSSKSFASDNYSGIHPKILSAIEGANRSHAAAYGNDPWTAEATAKFQTHFGQQAQVHFVFNGTAANVLAIGSVTQSFNAVICAQTAHLNNDECGAPEKFAGLKLLPVPAPDGKLRVSSVSPQVQALRDVHQVQPKVISITQSTEVGTVYTLSEIGELAELAHRHGLYLHMDGARISNAAASLGCSLRAMTTDAGVDLLSFGGTKNGMMAGEAVVILRPDLGPSFKYLRKQGMQLASKMRFLSAQFSALLTDDLWLKNGAHSNRMAKLLADEVRKISPLRITRPVEANGVFVEVPRKIIEPLQALFPFYVWDDRVPEVRWMTSFDTTEEDIEQFVSEIKRLVTTI